MSKLTWNQPTCDSCWAAQFGSREPRRMPEDVREVETCSYCGSQTESGIYRRDDPRTVPYPQEER